MVQATPHDPLEPIISTQAKRANLFKDTFGITRLTRDALKEKKVPCVRSKKPREEIWIWLNENFGINWIWDLVGIGDEPEFYYWFIDEESAALTILRWDKTEYLNTNQV